MTPHNYAGPIFVTLAYLVIYYAFITNVLVVKTRLGREYAKRQEKFDRYFSADRQMLAADRTQLNMLEHMAPFLVLLWLSAVFVGTTEASIAGGIYVATRATYPLVLGKNLGHAPAARISWVTYTGYAILGYFAVRLSWAAMAQ